jgi:formylglycine-generating enzyme required for sulfatase activity
MKKFSSLLIVLLLALGSFTARAQSYQRGDVNQDGAVDNVDVTTLSDNLLNGTAYGDVDLNGMVNIADVTCLIDYLLSGSWPESNTYTVNGVTFKMVEVEGGTFTMGSTPEQGSDDSSAEEYTNHQVTLSSYSIGQTEVTQELWQAVMGSNPSEYTSAHGYTDDLSRPVDNVSWDDCQTFITQLNEMTGKKFRLPTEAEWEYAARGGNQSQGYTYAGSNTLDEVAWYWDDIPSQTYGSDGFGTQPVATKAPNELGLYDMSGNVYEWCLDYTGDYSSEAQTNPTGPASGYYKEMRGGSWDYDPEECRVWDRMGAEPSAGSPHRGMRLVLSDLQAHELVDLGLPSGTLWATYNVGATAPEEYGDYFAWGETAPKDYYDWSTYKWCNGSETTLTKYCAVSDYGYNGFTDGKTVLDSEDDAATVNWGSWWCMPTVEQLTELYENCSSAWTTMNDVNGRLFTGPNGNTLFLPAAGRHWGESLMSAGDDGYYWSRTLYPGGSGSAIHLGFQSEDVRWNNNSRYYGFAVRAVRVSQ